MATRQHQLTQRAVKAHVRALGLTKAAAAPPALKRVALMSAVSRKPAARLYGGGQRRIRGLRGLW
jgi:hypothetical protein